MSHIHFVSIVTAVLMIAGACRADHPATEFFVIKTETLAKLAANDSDLDALSSSKLREISVATGWYKESLKLVFTTETFRINAQFSGIADFTAKGPASIGYNIDAGKDHEGWSVASERGRATKLGKQFVTENWRTQPVVVVLRFLDLKQ